MKMYLAYAKMKFIRAIIFISLFLSSTLVTGDVKPFWTEKSSYIEGRYLYVVGIATNSISIEKGRKKAFENGKNEIMNFSQLSNIDGLKIGTQMTFDEAVNGGHNIYRLMFVNYESLNILIGEKIKETKRNYKKHQEKQQEELKIKTVALEKIKRNNAELDKLDILYNKIAKNIKSSSVKTARYIKIGMTENEVQQLIGRPRTTTKNGSVYNHNYGKYWVIYGALGNTVSCVSTLPKCITTFYSHMCNLDNSICKDDSGNVTYRNKIFED